MTDQSPTFPGSAIPAFRYRTKGERNRATFSLPFVPCCNVEMADPGEPVKGSVKQTEEIVLGMGHV